MTDGSANSLLWESPSAVCVTGSTGYIGSWLVRSLLQRGYVVHATARDLWKAAQLQESVWECVGGELKLFRADMDEEGSYDEAMQGCTFVFHVAACMDFHAPSVDNDYVRREVLRAVVRGTLNVMKSCRRAGSVKRVVFTSSISTATARDSLGELKPHVDESSVVDVDSIWLHKPPGWVAAENAALRFAKDNGIEFISVVPTTVAGPFLTPHVPASIRVLLSPITNDPELLPIIQAVYARLGSISLVHVEDVVSAIIFLVAAPQAVAAEGRFLCSGESCNLACLARLLSHKALPLFSDESLPVVISSKKLTDLGFEFKHKASVIVRDAKEGCIQAGFLSNDSS
ncbi:NAD(P)-binding Rossmann-fold superfamily protein isoform X2 [Wolffia australiana]